jgi:anti-sigma factor RsiW
MVTTYNDRRKPVAVHWVARSTMPRRSYQRVLGRFAARVAGLASGLALAVRPAGLAEVSGAQGWVLKIVSAKRLETIFRCP